MMSENWHLIFRDAKLSDGIGRSLFCAAIGGDSGRKMRLRVAGRRWGRRPLQSPAATAPPEGEPNEDGGSLIHEHGWIIGDVYPKEAGTGPLLSAVVCAGRLRGARG